MVRVRPHFYSIYFSLKKNSCLCWEILSAFRATTGNNFSLNCTNCELTTVYTIHIWQIDIYPFIFKAYEENKLRNNIKSRNPVQQVWIHKCIFSCLKKHVLLCPVYRVYFLLKQHPFLLSTKDTTDFFKYLTAGPFTDRIFCSQVCVFQ